MGSDIQFVHRSSTRRKACFCCIKAKRRCDQALPACSRCEKRYLCCRYEDNEIAIAILSSEKRETPIIKSTAKEIIGTPWDSFQFPELGRTSPEQLRYCTSIFRGCISSFVLENRTPFIHPSLYSSKMPEELQDCLGISALYTQKTAHNSDIIFRMLDGKLESLIASLSHAYLPEQTLLAVQVLIIYQIIRAFDSDERQRINAERHMALLEMWTVQLQTEYFEACFIEYSDHQWIALESIRRTILVSILLRALHSISKSGTCDLVPLMVVMPVSRGGSWDEAIPKDSELITYGDFVDEWNGGRVSRLGDYEKLLLRACHLAKW